MEVYLCERPSSVKDGEELFPRAREAPAAIIAGIEAEEWIEATPSRQVVPILDIGFAAENLILTAQALGIGSCPIASFNGSCIKSILQAPATFHPLLRARAQWLSLQGSRTAIYPID